MKKKKQSSGEQRSSEGHDHFGADSDFYSARPDGEQPLYEDRYRSSMHNVSKTGRHQAAVPSRPKQNVDPRDRAALAGILKSAVLLVIAFFVLWKGVSIYEEREFLRMQGGPEAAPVMEEMVLAEDFDIENQGTRDLFAERVESWKESVRLVRSVDALLLRSNYDQAIERCQAALRRNPSHLAALEYLGELYFEQGMLVESINAYIRLLNIDPMRTDVKVKLIEVLDAHADSDAVVFMAKWFQEENEYDGSIQRYLAHALFAKEEYTDAIEAYRRVLVDDPDDAEALEKSADAHIYLEQYAAALDTLEKLQETNYRDQQYYRKIAVCNAQLGRSQETVQTLSRAAHLFGQEIVIGWVQDPRLDPVREARVFQTFAEKVGGEEFRRWLEQVAKSMEQKKDEEIEPQLNAPTQEKLDPNLLKREP